MLAQTSKRDAVNNHAKEPFPAIIAASCCFCSIAREKTIPKNDAVIEKELETRVDKEMGTYTHMHTTQFG